MSRVGGTETNVSAGIEATPGTPVAPTYSFKWSDLSLQGIAEKSLFTSQRGVRNEVSNSMIKRKYGRGNIGVVPNPKSVPFLFYLALGSLSTAGPTDSAYTHTITVQNANGSMKTATFVVERGAEVCERFAGCVVDTLTLDVSDDYGKLTAALMGGYPDSTTLSESFAQETEFAYSQMLARFGSTLTVAAGSAALEVMTSDATAPADGATITVGPITYTFKTALTNGGNTPYEVLINTTAAAALTNLKKAINASGTPGTDYGHGTVAHPLVFATTITATALTVQALQSGTAANSIATTTAGTSHITWAGATMNSGTPGTGPNPTPLKAFSVTVDNQVDDSNAYLSGQNTPVPGGFTAGRLKVTGSYTLPFDTAAEYNAYLANTKNALIVTLQGAMIGATTPELVTIKFGRLVLTGEPIQMNLGGITMIQQTFQAEYEATDKEITVVVQNTVASY